MVLTVEHPAPLFEARQLMGRLVGLKPINGQVATFQLAKAATYGFRVDGRLVGILGFYPLGQAREEVFAVGLPPDQVGPFMLPLLRHARLILAKRAEDGITATVAFVAAGHLPGQRMATIAGFRLVASDEHFERWERHERDCTGAERPVRRQQGGPASG